MVNLLVDIGNSSVKACYASGTSLEQSVRYSGDDVLGFIKELTSNRAPEIIAISSVKKFEKGYFSDLKAFCSELLLVDNKTKLPIDNLYKTPDTLGVDRLVSAIAANALFPGKDVIIFDFGTALTIDFITKKGEFSGGNISPGLRSRFRSLSDYTQQLPLVENPSLVLPSGGTTIEAIESGVVLGLIFEVEGYIKLYPHHIYIFTGGDAIYFAEKLKSSIFVVYNLVLMGLARVAQNYAKPKQN